MPKPTLECCEIDFMREETSRLVLRDVYESDIENIVLLLSEEESQSSLLKEQRDLKLMRSFFESVVQYNESVEYLERSRLVCTVQDKSTNNLIGICTISNVLEGRSANMGWHLGTQYKGHGYATEIAIKLIDIGLKDRKAKRVYSDCFDSNIANINVFTKAGMLPVASMSIKRWFFLLKYFERKPIVRYEKRQCE